jgi:nitroreductase
MRTTFSGRDYTSDPIPDDTIYRILDHARFAPSGGNRQGWRVVVVQDGPTRRRLRDLYLEGWYEYLALGAAGLTPWSPVADRAAEARALAEVPRIAEQVAARGGGFAEHLDEVPVLLALFADLGALAAVDRDLGRYTLAGGASIYPFAWNLLLAARAEGLGGVITTMPIRREVEVKELLGAHDDLALAAVVALGHPARPRRRLTRAAVEEWTTIDRLDGPPFTVRPSPPG